MKKNNTYFTAYGRFIIAVIDKKAQGMFQIGDIEIFIGKIGREAAVAV